MGTFEATKPVLMITDPELAKDVLVTNFNNFSYNSISDRVNSKIDPLFAHNPFLKIGEEWKKVRAELSPAITMQRVR